MSYFRPNLLRTLQAPPRIVAARVWHRLHRLASIPRDRRQRSLDQRFATYLPETRQERLARLIQAPNRASLKPHAEILFALAQRALAHQFDLLGSGPVEVRHGVRCRGFAQHRFAPGATAGKVRAGAWLESVVNAANIGESRRIGSLVDESYTPIDWQLDFKSGFRWSSQTWYRDIAVDGNPVGADVKLPWELARSQHLPQLALAYSIARESDPPSAEAWEREFRNQVLDFVAANPPRFGVNWSCTMDVAIRAANWVVAYDFFRACGARFDAEFDSLIARSVREHAQHIATNLEWAPGLRSNHYLADICGLLFVAAYLPAGDTADAWLALALQELPREVQYQFYAEGSNVEASTCYHRLAGEMVAYSVALALGLPRERLAGLQQLKRRRFPGGVVLDGPPEISASGGVLSSGMAERIARMADFTRDITSPTGLVAQFGDNDSGRFFKLPGTYRRLDMDGARGYRVPDLSGVGPEYVDEEALDHRHFVAAVGGLLGGNDPGRLVRGREVDAEIIGLFSGGRNIATTATRAMHRPRSGSENALESVRKSIRELPEGQRQRYEFAGASSDLEKQLRTVAYEAFGLYIAQSEHLYLAIRCGRLHPLGSGSHAHNDQLSFELWIDGRKRITDPGTWVYTPLAEERNRYRSTAAHFTPRVVGREPSRIDQGLFMLQDSAGARCLYFGRRGFAGEHHGFGAPVLRAVTLESDRVIVEDGSLGDPLVRLEATPSLPVSSKYGCQLA